MDTVLESPAHRDPIITASVTITTNISIARVKGQLPSRALLCVNPFALIITPGGRHHSAHSAHEEGEVSRLVGGGPGIDSQPR